MTLMLARQGLSKLETCGYIDGRVKMKEVFLTGVRSIVEPLLIQLGFQLEEFGDVDYYGRTASVMFFRSKDCKVQVYDAPREGEINCMIAPLDAANVFGLYDRSGKWQYFPRSFGKAFRLRKS